MRRLARVGESLLPQFNWSVLGPIVAGIAAVVVGASLLVSHVPRAPSQPAHAAAPFSAASPTAAGGVRLKGRVIGTPHLRPQPRSTTKALEDLQSGETVDVSACSDSCGWYLVTPAGQTSPGWVASAFIMLQGDERKLAIVK